MRSPGHLAQRFSLPGGHPCGPATDTLTTVAARTVTVVRGIAAAYVAVQVAIWTGFYAADPWRLAGPVIAIAAAIVLVRGLHRGWPRRQLAVADAVVAVALALCAGACVPPAMRGDTANWLYLAILVQLVMPALCTTLRLTALLAVASGLAYWDGETLTRASGGSSPAAAALLLVALAAALCWGRHALARRAALADEALARADRDDREQFVVMSRSAERREHERLLHDTVLNTLTALARAGARLAGVIGQCRSDVTLVEQALGDAGMPAGTEVPLGQLLGGIEAAAAQMRDRGLDVRVEVAAPAGERPGAVSAAGATSATVPAAVASAAVHAVREALANVLRHAVTSQSWVEVGTAPGCGPGAPSGLEVRVRDAGVGFDPARVDPTRLGLRRSVVERVADSGGEASVWSAPGAGTQVFLRWPGRRPAGGPRSRPEARAGAAGDGLVQDTYEAALPRMVAGVAVVWQLTTLIQVLAYEHDFRQPAIPAVAWLAMLIAAGWLVPRARAGRFRGREAAIAIGVAVAAVALVGWDRRVNASGSVDWSVAGTAWLLALVALCRPAWEWATGAAAVFAVHAAFTFRVLGMTPLGQARLAVTGYTIVVVLAVFATLRPAIHAQARVAACRSALASRAAAERDAAEAIQRDRRERLALLDIEALPLLRAIAGERLDPGDPAVRERCAWHAAALRRALVDRARPPAGLLADLEPVLDAARDSGVPVEVQVIGDPGPVGRDVAGALTTAISEVIAALPPHPVTLTVLAPADQVELYVIFQRPPPVVVNVSQLRPAMPPPGWQATLEVGPTGAGCLEVRWQKVALV